MMQFTYDFETDVCNMAMEKIAAMGQWMKAIPNAAGIKRYNIAGKSLFDKTLSPKPNLFLKSKRGQGALSWGGYLAGPDLPARYVGREAAGDLEHAAILAHKFAEPTRNGGLSKLNKNYMRNAMNYVGYDPNIAIPPYVKRDAKNFSEVIKSIGLNPGDVLLHGISS